MAHQVEVHGFELSEFGPNGRRRLDFNTTVTIWVSVLGWLD
jgi:hypothetical protein